MNTRSLYVKKGFSTVVIFCMKYIDLFRQIVFMYFIFTEKN